MCVCVCVCVRTCCSLVKPYFAAHSSAQFPMCMLLYGSQRPVTHTHTHTVYCPSWHALQPLGRASLAVPCACACVCARVVCVCVCVCVSPLTILNHSINQLCVAHTYAYTGLQAHTHTHTYTQACIRHETVSTHTCMCRSMCAHARPRALMKGTHTYTHTHTYHQSHLG